MIHYLAKDNEVGICGVVMVPRDSDDAFASAQRGKPCAKPLEFVWLVVDKITYEANDIRFRRGDLPGHFGEFRFRKKESDMEVTQERQTEAVEVGPASREFNGDFAKHAGATQDLTQDFARRRLLQGPDDSCDQAAERA